LEPWWASYASHAPRCRRGGCQLLVGGSEARTAMPSRPQIWCSRVSTNCEGSGGKRKRVQRDCSAGITLFTWLQMRQKRAFLRGWKGLD